MEQSNSLGDITVVTDLKCPKIKAHSTLGVHSLA